MKKFETNTFVARYPLNKELYIEVKEVEYLSKIEDEYEYLPLNIGKLYRIEKNLEVYLGEIEYFHSAKCIYKNEAYFLFDNYSMNASTAIQKYNKDINPQDVYIEKLLIENQEKGKGYGKILIKWLENYTNSNNIFLELPKVSLNWTDDNYKTLSDFYKKSFTLDLISLKDNLMVFGFLDEEDNE